MHAIRRPSFLYILAAGALALFLLGRYLYFLPRLDSGAAAPDFSAVLPSGQPFQLSQLRDRYVLLHFWGSWCGPCRRENRKLTGLYDRYKDAGFAIVSVGIEQDTARWKRAIARDGLSWPHQFIETTPSLRFFDSPIANSFGVKKLPALFLLRPGGSIEAVDPAWNELEAALDAGLR